jgi:hypothetical protein
MIDAGASPSVDIQADGVLSEIVGGRVMSVFSIDPLPLDIHENVVRLSATSNT